MNDFKRFINKYVLIDYSSMHHFLYSYISKVEQDEVYLIVSSDFEKTGLLIDDEINCKIDDGGSEYYFKAKISGIDIRDEGLTLIIVPSSEVEQYINLRASKRISLKILSFLNDKKPASVLNISEAGLLLSTKDNYKIGEDINIRIMFSYPTTICNLIGEVTRHRENFDDRKEYGIKIKKFVSNDDELKYRKFLYDLMELAINK